MGDFNINTKNIKKLKKVIKKLKVMINNNKETQRSVKNIRLLGKKVKQITNQIKLNKTDIVKEAEQFCSNYWDNNKKEEDRPIDSELSSYAACYS